MSDELDITIVTGLSGAGRSEAANVLEDLGFFVIDNLPPLLIPKVAELARVPGPASDPLRPRRRRPLRGAGGPPPRPGTAPGGGGPHPDPLPGGGRRRPRPPLRGQPPQAPAGGGGADVGGHRRGAGAARAAQGRGRRRHRHVEPQRPPAARPAAGAVRRRPADQALQTNIVSFGFKHGLPLDVDLVFDCRFLPNPHWVESLRPLRGTDPKVKRYVMKQDGDRGVPRPSWSGSSPCSCRPT